MNEEDCNKYRKLGINEVGDIKLMYDNETLSQIGEILSLKIALLYVDNNANAYGCYHSFLEKTDVQLLEGWEVVIIDDVDEGDRHEKDDAPYSEWVVLVPTGSNLRRLVLANLDKIVCLIEQL